MYVETNYSQRQEAWYWMVKQGHEVLAQSTDYFMSETNARRAGEQWIKENPL